MSCNPLCHIWVEGDSWHDASLLSDLGPVPSPLRSLHLVLGTLQSTAAPSAPSPTASLSQARTGLSRSRPWRSRGLTASGARASPGLKERPGPLVPPVPQELLLCCCQTVSYGVGLKDNSTGGRSSPLPDLISSHRALQPLSACLGIAASQSPPAARTALLR